MDSEPQFFSLRERIASLQLSQVGVRQDARLGRGALEASDSHRPPLPKRAATTRVEPSGSNSSEVSNLPDELKSTAVHQENAIARSVRPQLPPRQSCGQPTGPSLPPRCPFSRTSRDAPQPTRSPSSPDPSIRTVPSSKQDTEKRNPSRVRAPHYDPSSLPPLPSSRRQPDEVYVQGQRTSLGSSGKSGTSSPTANPGRSTLDFAMNRPASRCPAVTSSRSPTVTPPQPSLKAAYGSAPPVPLDSRPKTSNFLVRQADEPQTGTGFKGLEGISHCGLVDLRSKAACLICRDFSAADTHAARFPRQQLNHCDPAQLAADLCSPFDSHTDKARAIFVWEHHNIAYDVQAFMNGSYSSKDGSPAGTMARGLAVCQGYAALFVALALHAGLEALMVSGHGKGFGYAFKPGDTVPRRDVSGHAWVAVKIDGGRWKTMDPCWGAGALSNGVYKKGFNSEMFSQSNIAFSMRHHPGDLALMFREDGRQDITWEEYIMNRHIAPKEFSFDSIIPPEVGDGFGPNTFSCDAVDDLIDRQSFRPRQRKLAISSITDVEETTVFEFSKACAHWVGNELHQDEGMPCFIIQLPKDPSQSDDHQAPIVTPLGIGLALGAIRRADNRRRKRSQFHPLRFEPRTGIWRVEIATAELGPRGESVKLCVVTDHGEVVRWTPEEFLESVGRKAMAWSYLATWELV